ncbi:unnamed protein product [Prorocentrum cordatum]|uniref:Uncharacterized protein n=1 Tax=Prorocentrum cordatum TaxID=2364126 RepID=A0ABN9PTH2_9DINO|nr:unnamed protein product [Polarella glacialis]
MAASVVLGLLWHLHGKVEDPIVLERRLRSGGDSSGSLFDHGVALSIFIALQTILAAGFDAEIDTLAGAAVYTAMLLVGLILFGTLVGMITESFESLIERIRQGELKAVEEEHTVLLGWSECTPRLVCQLAFLRRQFQQMNEPWDRRLCWWRRVKASTSAAQRPIIVMCNTLTKEEMENAIAHAFQERGICALRTRLGCDVVCRVGDPRSVVDLRRVCVQQAHAVVVQAGEGADTEKSTGASIRTLMALRFALYTCQAAPAWDDLRIVVEMNQPSKVVSAAAFDAPGGGTVVHPLDLSVFLDSLLFACLGQPGLAQTQMELMSFESAAIKFRKAADLNVAHRKVSEATMLWEDAVFVGVQAREAKLAAARGEGVESGLLPGASYEIQPDDTVLFLCRSSMPTPAARRAEAEGVASESPFPYGQEQQASFVLRRREIRVLICGDLAGISQRPCSAFWTTWPTTFDRACA